MHPERFARLTAAASLLLSLSFVPMAGADVTYSGRAYAAFVNLPTLGVGPIYVSDTGELPPSGGSIRQALLSIDIPAALRAEALVAMTSGADGLARSSASLAEVTVLPGHAAQLTASFVRAESEVTCDSRRGTTDLARVTFGGLDVEVTGAPNQTVDIPGLATLVVNEQRASTGDGVQFMTVNALHLTLFTGDEVILSHAHSDVAGCPGCPPPPSCDDFVTGGGWIGVGSSRANFGFNAGFRGGSPPEIHLNYIDHSTGLHVKATSISVYRTGDTPFSRHFEGSAEVNGVPGVTYAVDVADKGEPGRRTDTFRISLGNGYSAGGTLDGGNIQLHKPCP